ncbi:MAG TPA: B12-binding domain-containing protein [Pyrinomonadaceae bacterium]|nr:B12-binding domain-containing protein [Pyrinomonadaceae bacterium]
MTQTPAKFLTTRRLARLWLVSEATVKRWADTGQLKSARTAGGHRRFPLSEVLRFQAERGLGAGAGGVVVAARGAGQGEDAAQTPAQFDAEATARHFFESVTRGHSGEASALLLEAHMRGVAVEVIFDEVLAPALRQVGAAWHTDTMSVAEEHLATSTASRAVETLAGSTRRAGAHVGEAVCCAAEGEMHTVAVLCVQAALEAAGWDARNLGGHTPFFALAEYVARHRPALVCVSSTMQWELEHNARDYSQLAQAALACGARVVLGGEGFRDEAVRARFPADLHAESVTELTEFLARPA